MVAARLGMKCFSINELARSYRQVSSSEGAVDVRALRHRLQGFHGAAVLYGHLLPYVIGRESVARVAVLRCEPKVLKQRLASRDYPKRKLVENVEAELIGVVSADTYDAFGSEACFEIATTESTPEATADALVDVIQGVKEPGPRIDWTPLYDSGRKLRSLLST
jgi:adenylate kinase